MYFKYLHQIKYIFYLFSYTLIRIIKNNSGL